MLVIVICFGLHQNLGYYTPNGTRVDNTSVISSTRDILKFTVSEKYNNRKNRNIRIVRQTLSYGLNMSGILHNRIVKAMFFFSVCQYLSPVSLMFISKNPTAIIFYLKHNNAGFRSNGNINLGICAVRFLQV